MNVSNYYSPLMTRVTSNRRAGYLVQCQPAKVFDEQTGFRLERNARAVSTDITQASLTHECTLTNDVEDDHRHIQRGRAGGTCQLRSAQQLWMMRIAV